MEKYTNKNNHINNTHGVPDIDKINNDYGQNRFASGAPTLSLPKGGGAIKSIEEKFKVNSSSGTFAFTIPIPLSPSRNNNVPALNLNYNSGSGNSPFGLGWNLSIPAITRKTDKSLPQYKDEEESDVFILAGVEDMIPLMEKQGSNWIRYQRTKQLDGVPYKVKRYRPRIESLFFIIEKWQNQVSGECFWKTISKENVHTFYGLTSESRIYDPKDPGRVFSWLICKTYDDKGSITLFKYKTEDFAGVPQTIYEKNRINNCTQVYLKEVYYGNRTPYYQGDQDPAETDFLFRVTLDYGEHDASEAIPKDIHLPKSPWKVRKDVFSSYRSGFEIRTYRRCNRILIFHCFDAPDLPHNPYLVKSLELFYNDNIHQEEEEQKDHSFSFLNKFRHNGHQWDEAINSYKTKFLPEIEIEYQPHEWNTTVIPVSVDSLAHAPSGIDNKRYLWVDLFNEGIAGILSEQSGTWYYKSNLGNGKFSHASSVAQTPSYNHLTEQSVSIMDIAGNGDKYLVQLNQEPRGYFKMTDEDDWEPFKAFKSFPSFNLNDPNLKPIDLTGDGKPDLLITEENVLRWFKGKGDQGFEISQTIAKEIDEEKGPAILFADVTQSIFLADMDGDGLTDIVRIKNGEVCYWPNLGYGKFGTKVTMEAAPLFDHPDLFNPKFLRLADIDGSGTTDVVYLGRNNFKVWLNQSGNRFSSTPKTIAPFPKIDNLSDVAVMDFLGTGTSCIVYSSPVNHQPLQYIDLMESKKPHLLAGYKNNCGKLINIEYKSSSHFYLEDKLAGRDWATKLPFPVHCVAAIRSEDKIRQTKFINTYRYSHGHFDALEKEFRGFARVEQIDTETFENFKINEASNVVEEDLHQPPVRTVTWFHTGTYLPNKKIQHQLKEEYYKNASFTELELPEPEFPSDLANDELREAFRALKGLPLRTEVYADDNSDKKDIPYTSSSTSYKLNIIQPKSNNQNASFLVTMSESIAYTYERNPGDPRITHSHVIETDELGNILKSANVVYPRVKRPLTQPVPDKVWSEQKKLHIVYEEAFFTKDIISDHSYRQRALYERKAFEVAGIEQPDTFYLTRQHLQTTVTAGTLMFEEEFTGGVQKRLSGHSRSYYIKDDLSGPLPLGELNSLGIGFKSYKLTFTKNLISKLYGSKVSDQMLTDSMYTHSEGDEHWWAQSGEVIFPSNPQSKFYIPSGIRDVYGNECFMKYDKYSLLLESTTDAIGNTTTSQNNYRLLSTAVLTDANMNRSAVENDELGFVIKSATMGKEGANEGDTLDDPTAKMDYDLFNWKNNGKPNYVHSFMREQHGTANPRWQESYLYSDGSGTIIMMKGQAEPGKAKRWNPVTKVVEEIDANPRWVGNGRVILNNKGKSVKNYQPYFSNTHEYESEAALVETGVTSIYFYDPFGKNYLTKFPNGTHSRIEFDPWSYRSFDVNDTVRESQWYADRGSPDPLLTPEPSDPEQRAAWLSARDANTPAVFHSDSRGRSFYTIADYGNGKTTNVLSETDLFGRYGKVYDQLGRLVSENNINLLGDTVYTKTAEKGERWTFYDATGRLARIWDNNDREFHNVYDKLNRPVSSFVKQAGTETLFSHMVYGDLLPDAEQKNMKGRLHQVYDQTGKITITKIDFKGNQLQTERKLCKKYDGLIDWKILEGLNSVTAKESAAAPFLEDETYTSFSEVDALNRPVTVRLPDNTVIQPEYNEANFLDALKVQIRGVGNVVTFLEGQDYDAKGLRQFAKYGNGLVTNYRYDPETFRLVNVMTRADGENDSNSRQNISYTYDAVGNIVYTKDDAQQTHYFNNSVVKPEQKFEYNSIYQLVRATGRELAGLGGNGQRTQDDLPFISQLPHQNDTNAVANYEEIYQYDDCGNILQLQHIAGTVSWNQRYRYHYQDDNTNLTNQLKSSSLPGDSPTGPYTSTYDHDSRGNMTKMSHLNLLVYNFMNQLTQVDLGGGGKAYYVYGAGGVRTRKVIERPGGKRIERIYLGSVEIYREYQGTEKKLERSTVHISDNTERIAQADTKVFDPDNTDPDNTLNHNLIRYKYSNHLGSATLETDENGTVISYEEYHPYGTSSYRSSKSGTNLSLKRYRFAGKERDDETGFYYFGARYYAAWLARWTSSDPAGFAGGINLYRYCSNNPVMMSDPSGTEDYPTIWTYNPKDYSKEEMKILKNPNADPEKVLEILTAHGYRGGGPMEWKSDYGKHGGWVRMAPGESDTGGTGKGGGTGTKSSDKKGGGNKEGSGGKEGGDKGGETGSKTGGEKGSDKGSEKGSQKGKENGSEGGSPNGSPNGSPTGSATGSPNGSPNGKTQGQGQGQGQGGSSNTASTDSSGGGGGGGGRQYITSSFWRGLITGFAIAFTIVLFIALAPITIPASVAIGAAVIGVGLTAYSITQSVRQRDFFNRPISEEQANYNLGMGIGGIFGGAAGGSLAGPTASAGNAFTQGMRSLVPQLALETGVTSGGSIAITSGVSGTAVVTGQGVATGTGILMMESGEGGSGGGSGGSNPSSREFHDLDDAAEAVLGEGSQMGARIGPLKAIKNEGVIKDLKALGYNPDDFTPVQYWATDPKGHNYIITVFEAEGGVYFGPHLSSANF